MSSVSSRRPDASEFDSDYHARLVGLVEGECAMNALHQQKYWLCELASSLSTEQIDRVDAPYGWTVRQVFEHCANSERLFGYRIMCLADGSRPDLPGWDENGAADSRFGLGNFTHLISELADQRNANMWLLGRLIPRAWDASGTADGQRVTVRTLAWLLAGHLQHHLEIVEKRCGVTATRGPAVLE